MPTEETRQVEGREAKEKKRQNMTEKESDHEEAGLQDEDGKSQPQQQGEEHIAEDIS